MRTVREHRRVAVTPTARPTTSAFGDAVDRLHAILDRIRHPHAERRHWRAAVRCCVCAAAAVCVLAACTSAPGTGRGGPTPAGEPSAPPGGIASSTAFTALAARTLTAPTPVLGSDNRRHLVYELLLTDTAPAPVTVTRVNVRDAASKKSLLSLAEPSLSSDASPLAISPSDEGAGDVGAGPDPTVIQPGSTWVVWLDVTLGPSAQVPSHLEHLVAGTVADPSGPKPFDALVDTVATSRTPAAVLGPPVKGGTWYMSEGCCSGDTHHLRGIGAINGQLQVPQRFAIDFFALDAQHRALTGDPHTLSSYVSYGRSVIAAADGTVVDATDRFTDNAAPPELPTTMPPDEIVGNHVIERIGAGTYVLYAHLAPGSVTVHTGQQVHRGDPLARIGDSGLSATPHLHFQLLSTPTFYPTQSAPYVFDRFRLIGSVAPRIWDDNLALQPTDVLPVEASPRSGVRYDQLPLDRTVVQFPN